METKIAAVASAVAIAFSGAGTAAAESDSRAATSGDSYVLSNTFIDANGRHFDAQDGIKVESGSIELDAAARQNTYSKSTSTTIQRGSSYVKSKERLQYWYDGEAYASGKKDYRDGIILKRVVEACFKYTRDGKDVIGWQCSKGSLGPVFGPGKVVKKTVRDTLNPIAPKTTLRYSFKVI